MPVMAVSKLKSTEDIGENFITTEYTTDEVPFKIPEGVDVEYDAPKVFVEPPTKMMPTLPENFTSLVGCPITITNENRKPQNIITLLGDALGVNDYRTNIASFWFLDFIALQVLRFESALDDNDRSVMVSWLAGEMTLIRENNLSHEAFLRDMQDIFIRSSKNMSRGQPLRHWDFIFEENREEIVIEEDIVQGRQEPEVSQPKITKHRASSKSHHKRISSKDRSKHGVKTLAMTKIDESETIDKEDIAKPEDYSNDILDIVIEATYSMYGNSFHYALILAAFVNPVQLHEYNLPFTFRTPRPLKMFRIEKNTTAENSVPPRKSKEIKKNKTNDKKIKKSRDTDKIEIIQQPELPVTLNEEEILMNKRKFILPLMEANEVSNILETYREMETK